MCSLLGALYTLVLGVAPETAPVCPNLSVEVGIRFSFLTFDSKCEALVLGPKAPVNLANT